MFHERYASFAGPGPEARPAWLIIVAAGALTLFSYLGRVDLLGTAHPGGEWTSLTRPPLSLWQHNLAAALLLGFVPAVVAGFLNGRSWRGMGLGGGRRLRGILWLGVGIPVAILLGKLSAGHPEVQAVYPLGGARPGGEGAFVLHAVTQLAYYASWEILFRGVLLHGLTPRFGFAGANALQTALSVVAHFGRPMSETLAALPAGLAFGGVVRHTGTVWYVVIIHWTAGVSQDWFLMH